MTTTNILPYQPTSSPPALPGSSSPTDRIHGAGKLRSFFESVRHDDPSYIAQPKPGNHGHRSAAHHRHTGFGGGPTSTYIGPGPPPPNLHQEYERIMGKKPMSPRTLHAAEAAALALDPAARMAHNQQQQRVHTVPSRSSLVKSQFGSSIPNLQSIYPATRSSILASGPGLAGPASAKGKGTRSRSGSNNNASVSGSSRRRNGTGGQQQQQKAHSRHASTDSMAYQPQQQQPMIPYPQQTQYQGQPQQQQQPIWMSNTPPPLAPSVVNKIHSAHQSRSNSLNRQPAAQSPGPAQGGYIYPSSAPSMQDWQQQQQAFFAQQQQQQQQYMMQQYQQQQQMQQKMMYQPSPPPQAAALSQAPTPKKPAPKSKQAKSTSPPPPGTQPQPATKRSKASPPPEAQPPPPSDPPAKPARGPPPEGFVACSNCGRSFAPDRVAKHESICVKSVSSKRAPVDMSQVRKELIAKDNVGGAGGRQQRGGFG